MNRHPDHKEEDDNSEDRNDRTRYWGHDNTTSWPFILRTFNDTDDCYNNRWDINKKDETSHNNEKHDDEPSEHEYSNKCHKITYISWLV